MLAAVFCPTTKKATKEMINANELRVGNIFYFPFHKQKVMVLGFVKMDSGEYKVQFETNGGILLEPLTVLQPYSFIPKDLVELGFLYRKKEMLFNCEKWVFNDFKIQTGIYCFIVSYKNIAIKEVNYLHELQNFIHSLTGQELSVVANGS